MAKAEVLPASAASEARLPDATSSKATAGMATPIAAPSCRRLLNRAEPVPASSGVNWESASVALATSVMAIPKPLTTLVAFDFAGILGGAVITETVFGWSGMGKMFTTGLTNIDPNPVMAFFLITATATVLFNMLADIAYAYLDPRIRLG